jgi:glycosyltransferase involved in cell wall biosynthesis
MSNIISNNVDGFLVEPKNIEILAETISSIIELNPAIKEGISENAIKKTENYFSSHKLAVEYERFYTEVINRNLNI